MFGNTPTLHILDSAMWHAMCITALHDLCKYLKSLRKKLKSILSDSRGPRSNARAECKERGLRGLLDDLALL